MASVPATAGTPTAGPKGEQALRAVRALNEAIEAIWFVHGEAMAARLFEEPAPDERASADDNPF